MSRISPRGVGARTGDGVPGLPRVMSRISPRGVGARTGDGVPGLPRVMSRISPRGVGVGVCGEGAAIFMGVTDVAPGVMAAAPGVRVRDFAGFLAGVEGWCVLLM
jgi:hypothetical protein